jgi:hypothetical protein
MAAITSLTFPLWSATDKTSPFTFLWENLKKIVAVGYDLLIDFLVSSFHDLIISSLLIDKS